MQNHRSGSISDYTMNEVQDHEIEQEQRHQKKPLLVEEKYNLGSTLYQDSSLQAFSQLYAEEPYRQCLAYYSWLVLLIFSLATASMGALWGTLIPIASTLQDKEGLTWTYINLYTIVFYAAYIPFNFLFNWVIEEKGLRVAMVIAMLVCTVGSWMRVAFNYSHAIAVVGQTVAATVNPVFLNAPSKLASTWFKPNSRNLATNIAAVSNILGNAVGALVPTWIVQSGVHYRSSQVTLLMIVEAALLSFVLLLTLIFFKKKPKIPPSPAAAADRHSTCQSLKILISSCNFLVLTFSFFCANGSLNGITSVIQEIFSHYSYESPESYTSLISCLMFVVGFVGSFGFAIIADKTKKLKLLLFVANLLSAASLGFFTFFVDRKSKIISGVICCAFGCFNIATIPLSLELGSELTYPVGEANSSGVIMTSSQISGIALTYITSALFDSAAADDTHSAYITNLMNFILASVGAVTVLLINENLKRTKHELEVSSGSFSKISARPSSLSSS